MEGIDRARGERCFADDADSARLVEEVDLHEREREKLVGGRDGVGRAMERK